MTPTVRTLDQIMAELGSVYNPQIQSIQQRQNSIPGQVKAEEAGLQAKQSDAFNSILSGARQRGLGFSGIPLGEQAKYTASEYLPAIARLRQTAKEQAMSLQDAIYGIKERQQNQALGLRQYEQQRLDAYESEQRQLAAQRAAAASARAAAANPTFGNGGGTQGTQAKAFMGAKKDGSGFAFVDQSGQPISAARYAALNGQDVRDVLYTMGSQGDSYAAKVYNNLRQDPFFGKGNNDYDNKIKSSYKALFWGA